MDKTNLDLPQAIYAYYRDNFADLTFWKRLHFATRLANWDEDAFCKDKLAAMRDEVMGETDIPTTLARLYDRYSNSAPQGPKNAAELRMPYFEKYPELRTINIILFRALVYTTTYDIDCRRQVNQLFPDDTIGKFLDRLFSDKPAVAVLSTHAINALYLYRRLIQLSDDNHAIDLESLYELGKNSYDLQDKTHLKLFIYLYTHCIIGESLFYTRRVPEKHMDIYLAMIHDLELTIEQHFDDINLDSKCEYLACCQILGVESKIRERIENECSMSISPQGIFLVDVHNNNPQVDSSDFNKSEHRNVLYIMASRPYRPRKS